MFYVVMKGCYSDRHVVGVTTNETVANRLVEKFEGEYSWDKCYIETYVDGETMLEPAYLVRFNDSGEVTDCCRCTDEYDYRHVGEIECWRSGNIVMTDIWVSAETLETAIKISAERRAMYLAVLNGL